VRSTRFVDAPVIVADEVEPGAGHARSHSPRATTKLVLLWLPSRRSLAVPLIFL
jgi:hypothetical protein